MKKTTSRNGFTLIELIIVMVILGIMAAVAVPRYLDSIANAEESAEDAVISAIRNGLKQYANNSLLDMVELLGLQILSVLYLKSLLDIQKMVTSQMRMVNGLSSIMAMVLDRSRTRERTIAVTLGTMILVFRKTMKKAATILVSERLDQELK